MRLNRMKFAVVCVVLFSMTTSISAFAQSLDLKGVWVLDSVQVKEIMPDNIVEKTVRPNGQALFSGSWMKRFKLDTEGKASYTTIGYTGFIDEQSFVITNVPYELKDITENAATLVIDGATGRKTLSMRLLPDNVMIIEQSFTSVYYMRDIEIFWKMYYRRLVQ